MKAYRATEPNEALQIVRSCMAGEEGLIVGVNAAACVCTGELDTLDLEACAANRLTVIRLPYLGGSIVLMPGDLSLCRVTWGGDDWAPLLVAAAAEWLDEEKGLSVTQDENDVLADGKKVISWARATTREGWCQSVVHFSVGPMDLSLVRAVCTKPMTKTPGSLGDYGITAEEIIEALGVIGNG